MIRLGCMVRHRTDADDDPPGLITERRDNLDGSVLWEVAWSRELSRMYYEQELVLVKEEEPYG